ncbi:MAG: tetrahydrofolate dehydrogenase/cyclohydrolase catalytic domain-containing protein [Halothiobacillus sp.]
MTARIIGGKALSIRLREEFRQRVGRLAGQGVVPGLVVIRIGDDPASRIYVGNKIKACEECGGASFQQVLAADASEADVLACIRQTCASPEMGKYRPLRPFAGA